MRTEAKLKYMEILYRQELFQEKKLSNIRGLFSHTQKGSVDVLRARHGDAPFDRPRGRRSRACTGFCIMVVVTNISAASV